MSIQVISISMPGLAIRACCPNGSTWHQSRQKQVNSDLPNAVHYRILERIRRELVTSVHVDLCRSCGRHAGRVEQDERARDGEQERCAECPHR